jgi:MoaA/NifB/PqqE/SkfB family radical SAM enzyme
MSLDMLAKFLADYKNFSPTTHHTLTGGEPTVYPKLNELYDVFRKAGCTLHMVTNGQLDKGRKITIANKDIVKSITVSFDAPTAEVNDKTRGPGTFDKAVQAVREYHAAGISVMPFYVLHDANAHLMREAFELAKNIGVKHFQFTTLHPVQRATDAEMKASNDRMFAAIEEMNQLNKEYGFNATCNAKTIIPDTGPTWNCSVLNESIDEMVLLPTGEVSLCCDTYDVDFDFSTYNSQCHVKQPYEHFDEIIGNVSKEPLADVVHRRLTHVSMLKARREFDAYNGKLTGTRQYMCENCKFYHFHSITDTAGKAVIPIKILRSK